MHDWRQEKVVITGPLPVDGDKHDWATGSGKGRMATVGFSNDDHSVYGTVTIYGRDDDDFATQVLAWLGEDLCQEWRKGIRLSGAGDPGNLKVILRNGKLAGMQVWNMTAFGPDGEKVDAR